MRLNVATLLCLSASISVAADVRPPPSFYARADELADWIDRNSDYGPMRKHPTYLFLNQDQLNYVFFGASEAGYTGREQSDALALYDEGIVFLSLDVKLGLHDDVLLHEPVHHLQAEQKRKFPCIRAGEKDAYELQVKFISETGIGTPPDPMWTLVASSCFEF